MEIELTFEEADRNKDLTNLIGDQANENIFAENYTPSNQANNNLDIGDYLMKCSNAFRNAITFTLTTKYN